MVLTDPPYNVGFKYNLHDDTRVDYVEWKATCAGWLSIWKAITGRIIITPGCNNLELWARLTEPSHIAPWIKKNAMTNGRVTHLWNWEPIFFLGSFKRKRANDVFEHHVMSGFLRDRQEAPVAKGEHPCPKPLALWIDLVENFSEPTETVFDPFLGSGTTLIACEKTGRRCLGMEIDPKYADVIISRYRNYSGKPTVREDGVEWVA
jgi:DNA modification methylase